MPRQFSSVVLLLLGVLLGGCASSSTNSASERRESGAETVHVYDEARFSDATYERIGTVTGVSCKKDVYSESPSRSQAVSELKQRTARAGGNGVLGVTCRKGQTTNCAQAQRCTGTAIRIQPVDAIPRIAQQQPSASFGGEEVRSGTGWVLAPGLVVTSNRLVEGRSTFSVATPDDTVSATLVAQDEVHNLALLRPAQSSVLPRPLPLAVNSAKTGERVFTVGYPNVEAAGIRTAIGIISAQSGALGDARVYRTTVSSPFDRGGAPFLNFQGEVIGVLVSAPATQGFNASGGPSESVSYAVKNKYLWQLRTRLEQMPDSLGTPSGALPLRREASALPPLLDTVRPSILRVTAR
ncbi:MAG: serine protease [Salinibacter sp.]